MHFTGSNSLLWYNKISKENKENNILIPFEESRIVLFNNIMDVLNLGYSIENLEYANISFIQLISSFIHHDYLIRMFNNEKSLDVVNNSITYVMENMGNAISVKEIANNINYTPSHFLYLFKKKTGFSPIHYFNNLKIQRACQYLSFTDMTIKEICFNLGYNDPLYFSRLFKKMMSISPNQYRINNHK
jgi:AraC-like DNA-binding protein